MEAVEKHLKRLSKLLNAALNDEQYKANRSKREAERQQYKEEKRAKRRR